MSSHIERGFIILFHVFLSLLFVYLDEEKVRVNITTYLNGEAEELVISSNATNDFHATVSVKDYQFGTKTNRSIRIYIYDFSTPLVIKACFHLFDYTSLRIYTGISNALASRQTHQRINLIYLGISHAAGLYESSHLFPCILRLLSVFAAYCCNCLEGNIETFLH